MARFSFRCTVCGKEFTVSARDRLPVTACPACGGVAKNVFKVNGGVSVMERLDNGVMARAVERLHNVEEIVADVADKDSAEYKERVELKDE